MSRQALFDLLSSMGQSAARSRAFIDTIDDVAAAKLLAAAESGDMRSVMRAMADQTWGTAPARPAPQAPAPTGSRSPMPFEQRIAGDREIRKTIDSAGVPPALRAAVDAGEPEASMEAYRGAVRRGGVEDSIRSLAKPADQVAAESIAGQFDRATGDAYQRIADGQSVVRRGEVPEDEYAEMVHRDLARQPFVTPSRQMELPFTDPAPVRRGPALADDMAFDEVPPRPRTAQQPQRMVGGRDLAAAAGIGGAIGIGLMGGGGGSGTDADLAAESSPLPDVPVDDVEPTVARAPADYSMRARFLINRLNDMRRAAGGEVPGAAVMLQEIDRLLALGNQTRRATAVAAPQDDASRLYQQAQSLIDQVNQMYRRGMSPNSPEVQRVMAQVRQLQAQGDAIRNRRAG